MFFIGLIRAEKKSHLSEKSDKKYKNTNK